jgi:bifunctional oligoribonuclease and PAP phosphatase NrnA
VATEPITPLPPSADGSEDPSAALDRAAAVLRDAPSVAFSGHVNPDPDSLGSMFGLASFLAARGAEVVCSWPNEPLEPPRWLGMFEHVPPLVPVSRFPKAPVLMVALDTASPDRLGSLLTNAQRAERLVVLDHHASNPGFGDVLVLDPAASSTAEIAYRLIERIGGRLPDEAAAFLFAGLVSDTGRFMYQATSPESLRIGAALREHAFDHAGMARLLYEDSSVAALRLTGLALTRLEFVPEADLVWTHLSRADLDAAGAHISETDDLIDAVRMAREADVASVIKEQRDGKLKVSLRSRGAHDVAAVAVAMGGGGHRLAAGYTSPGDLDATVAALVQALQSARVSER